MGTEEVMPTHFYTFIEGCLFNKERLRQQDLYADRDNLINLIIIIFINRERLRQQDLYADRDSAGDKALVMKQFLSDEKVDNWTAVSFHNSWLLFSDEKVVDCLFP